MLGDIRGDLLNGDGEVDSIEWDWDCDCTILIGADCCNSVEEFGFQEALANGDDGVEEEDCCNSGVVEFDFQTAVVVNGDVGALES